MNKTLLVIYSIILVAFGVPNIALAQMNKTHSAAISDDIHTMSSITTTTTTYPTFSAIGTISSLNFDNNSILDIVTAKKVILSGHWSLYVNNGSLSFFETDFIAAPADGGVSHTHQLVNLVSNDPKPIQLTSNGSTSIIGTVDVKINGVNIWNGVKVTIVIAKGSSVSITLNDMDTAHHFMRQPIYGIVNRLMF
jgi:hypothetical protein